SNIMVHNPSPLITGQDTLWQVPTSEIIELKPRRFPFALCIPVINEGTRIKKQLTEMREKGIFNEIDVLILDGGSSDGSVTPDFLQAQGVRTLLIKTGPGKLSAQLRMGYAYALREGYEGVITMDGNNKDGVEAVSNFIRDLEAGYDLIQGSRYLPGGRAENTPWMRHLGVKWIHVPLTNWATGFHYTDTTNGFRGYSRRFLLHPEVRPFRDLFVTYELIAYLSYKAPRIGFRVKEIPVTRRYPARGEVPTKISPFRGNWQLLTILLKVLAGRLDP
ncbi:MAG: glycosyltransferase family 2 protein, partial [Thermodesulfobacteriota bacterium]